MRKTSLYILTCLLLLFVSSCVNNKDSKSEVKSTKIDSIAIVIDTISTKKDSSIKEKPILSVKKRFRIGKQDSLSLNKAKIYVPSGSLSTDKEISITAIDSTQIAKLPTGMVNVTAGADGYRFLPHGEHFTAKAATIVLPFDSIKIPAGYTTKDIITYYYHEKYKRWEPLVKDTIDANKQLAYSHTEHFTDMINGILKVPESPETGNLTPTFISDYKPVNPASGITQIQKPTPNEQGTAVLNYPLNIPAARAGLTPNISLQYSSDGGSSYVGYGFSIPMETISIDTRWGCPTFSEEYESESYLLNGVQFTEKAHSHTPKKEQERKDKKEFYLRVDANFLNITRYGNSPKNYKWEVISKDGLKKTYTGFDGVMDSVSIESTATDKNLIVWVLTEVEDINGNTCSYSYQNYGGTLYPKMIEYTGHKVEKEKGTHKILFKYSPETENFKPTRLDITSSYRLGVEQKDSILLSNIEIFNSENLVRGYRLEYTNGSFGKTHLTSITEYDSKKNDFYSHSFEYFNDIESELYSEEEQWSISDSLYKKGSFFRSSKDGFSDEFSMLHGSHSQGFSVGGGAHVGFGINSFINVYAGSSYNYSQNVNDNKISLTDLNGDGLADLIFIQDGAICYRENISHKISKENKQDTTDSDSDSESDSTQNEDNSKEEKEESQFGETIKLKTTLTSFSSGKSETHTLLTDAGAQVFFVSGNACYSHNWQKNKTMVYLHDFNADGLIDIANNGIVHFNHIDSEGIPTLTTTSEPTPCPIMGLSVPIDDAFIPDVKAEQESLSEQFPRHDVVKLWRAPYDGKITIKADISLKENNADGVKFSIQHKDKLVYIDSTITDDKTTVSKSVKVQAGDKIYFRLQSRFNAVNDNIEFTPIIKYTKLTDATIDENGSLEEYVSQDEFLYCGAPTIPLSKTGSIHIEAPFSKKILSDDICLIVRKTVVTNYNEVLNDTKIEPNIVFSDIERRYLKASDIHNNEPMDIYLTVDDIDTNSGAYLSFIVESHSQIKWENITWKPIATYIGEEEPFVYVAPELTMYNKHIKRADSKDIHAQKAILNVDFSAKDLEGNEITSDLVNFSLKDKDGNVYFSAPISSLPIEINIPKRNNFYGTFHVKKEVSSYINASYSINGGDGKDAAIYSTFDNNDFGHLYRGWGQFAYNGEKEPNALIKEELLKVDTSEYEKATEGIDIKTDFKEGVKENQLSSIPSVNDQWFYIMQFSAKEERYESVANNSYVAADKMSSSRIGRQDLHVDEPDFPTAGTPDVPAKETAAPYITSSGEGDSFTGSAGAIATIGGGNSTTTSSSTQSLLDINGDGYPDWINQKNNSIEVIYTNANGQLTDKKISFDFNPSVGISKSETLTTGVSLSATTPQLIAPMGDKANWQIQLQKEGSSSNNTTSASVSISENFSSSKSISASEWIDFNADGLPDYVFEELTKDEQNNKIRKLYIKYNISGTSFTEPHLLFDNNTVISSDASSSVGAGLGVNVSICGQASAGGGISMTYTDTKNNATFRDMNGDGLVDYVISDGNGNTNILYNVGGKLLTERTIDKESIITSRSTSNSVSCNIAVPIQISIVSLTPSVTGSYSDGISKATNTIMDIDGDGFPDIVSSNTADQLKFKRSKIGRTGKLKSVILPLKGQINLDYTSSIHSYRNPSARFCLSMVEVTGGSKELGATSFKDTITYSGGNYNRCERTFLGFDTVSVSNLNTLQGDSIYRTTKTAYATNSFYTKGLVLSTSLLDSTNNVLSTTEYEYTFVGDTLKEERVYPALLKKTSHIYDDENALSTTRTYSYDKLGNLTSYSIDGELNANITYHDHKVVKNAPKSIEVTGSGATLQKRSSKIDDKGNVTQISVAVNDALEAVYDMEYDTYGNVTKFTRPENNNGERVSVSVKYDDTHHVSPIEVSDSYGFTSYTEYDKIFGLPIKQTDINGATIEYDYDNKGRLSTITAPKEAEKTEHTLKFDYILEGDNYKGITHHNTPEGGFEVYAYIDSLGREKYTETTSNIYEYGELSTKTIRSDYYLYDAFMRKEKQIKSHAIDALSYEGGVEIFSLNEYDEMDRTMLSTFIDGSEISIQYKIDTEEYTGKTTLICTTTDAEGRISNTYIDALGRTIATEKIVNGEPIRVVNTYDALSRVIEVLHPNEHISTYKYDMLGNIIETKTPDADTVTAEYTPQGQILSRTTATGEVVSYNYDFERLKSVAYSLHPNDSIVYTYGDTLSENFQKGRLLSVTYPMGSEEYTYGNMGEVVKTVKSIVIDEQIDKIHSYTSEFEYDSWSRIQKMIYPDGEVVDYEYYSNGELKAITGEKDGIKYPYLVETGYHESGQTAYRKLGNNTEHRYFYDKKNRLQLATLHIGSEKISENTYNYDKVDNITGINDNNTYYQAYTYDELNRLIGAKGSDNDTRGVRSDYSMTMEYNKMSSPVVFNQSISTEKGINFTNNTYLYNQDSQPNAPIQIGDMHYTYDAAGNPTSILDANGIGRDMVWDAENRLKEIIDTEKGLFHSYAYDHTGERILKRYGTAQSGYVNGKDMGTLYDFGESYSAYASAYFVESNNGYTKHYYAGATRLVSKLGEDYYENNELVPTGKEEKEQYFYFQDHLGSSTYITDLNGDIAQYTAYTPYGEMFREYNNVTPYRFNGKELDTETGLYYYGARYYNPATALWLGVDPLASKYPGVSPYVYCVGNPVKYVDPDGRAWEYPDGTPIEKHDNIKVYIFYDSEDFSSQTQAMAERAEKIYGKGSVALSNANTKDIFISDWRDMASKEIKEVNINYHGNNQTLMIDSNNNEYITSTNNGLTNKSGTEATNVKDIPNPIGNISNAQLNLNTCKSNSTTQYEIKEGVTLMRGFAQRFLFNKVRGTDAGVSYNWFTKEPEPQNFWDNWHYMKPIKK